MKEELARLDRDGEARWGALPLCRLRPGEVWNDPVAGHRVACLDAADPSHVLALTSGEKATLVIHDPPYNLAAFEKRSVAEYIEWCKKWVANTFSVMSENASLYIWLGADQNDGFSPLPEFIMIMREFKELKSRSFITLRNQRGYGTQKNWMAVRQELLFYTKGSPHFKVQYTKIPKTLKGYYKVVGGKLKENLERSLSDTIRPGNVWIDIQQVFYRMEENVSGCYAQKPLAAIDRIVSASSREGDIVADFFAHSGTTLLSAERLNRRCFTMDIDPVFCEITIRRLERFRKTGKTGWQNKNPFG